MQRHEILKRADPGGGLVKQGIYQGNPVAKIAEAAMATLMRRGKVILLRQSGYNRATLLNITARTSKSNLTFLKKAEEEY